MALVITPIAIVLGTSPAGAAATTYTPGTPALATITDPSGCSQSSCQAPWNEWQGDPNSPAYASQAPGAVLPTYEDGGATTTTNNGPTSTTPCSGTTAALTEPNLSVVPGQCDGTDGVAAYPSGVVGTPGPLDAYCGTGTNPVESNGTPARQPIGTTLPLAPAYFPHIVRNADGSLTGYFDYRPKDADESLVAARSTDGGASWTYEGEALEQDPGYCPTGDTNDDGEGHANVLTIGSNANPYVYTLERGAGDNVGVGMLVHDVQNSTTTDPLGNLPATEPTGIDPDNFASASAAITQTGGQPITFSQPLGTGEEGMVAGKFIDLTATPNFSAASIISCTGLGSDGLTNCTSPNAASGIAVSAGDLIEQVIATSSAVSIGAGPNTTNGDGGLGTDTVTVTDPNNLTMATFNANAPGRLYIDGKAVYCAQANALPTTKIEDCTTGPNGGSLSVASGDPILSDPIVPANQNGDATVQQTTGLVSPDGIVGVLPSYPGAPAGSTVVMYTEKVLNYFFVGYTGSATTFSANMTIPYTDFPNTASVSLGSGPTYTVYMGDSSTGGGIVTETCTGLTTTATGGSLTGCNGGTVGHSIAKNTYLAGPGAAITPQSTLGKTGEGSTKSSAGQKLFGNNEDLTVLRAAYTTDGVNFTDLGAISGQSNNTSGTGSYSDISNPVIQNSPANLNAYAAAGTTDADEMRFVGSAGSIITNPDGSYGLFLSGAWAGDGDSDSFNQIFYATSTDGEHWSEPVSVISTDYTFAASIAQDTASGDQPIGISAYYEGRAYGPSVVQNPNGTLTMVFAGYRFPKSFATAGSVLGTGSQQWTVGANDPTMYRNILHVTLASSTSPAVATTTTLSTPPSSRVVVGQTESVAATVAPNSPGTGTPTGSVTFEGTGGNTLCSAPLDEQSPDTASCTYTYSGPTDDSVSAVYGGDTNYATATSSSSPVTVSQDSTTTSTPVVTDTGTGDPVNPAVAGEQLTFSSDVQVQSPGVGTPTGTVTFADSGGTLCSATLNQADPDAASCTYTYSGPNPGDSITASYGGDTNDASSTSGAANEVVVTGTSSTALSSSANPSVTGQAVTIVAAVSAVAPATGTPGGTVTFSFNNAATPTCENTGDTVTLSGGHASCTVVLVPGESPETVRASYSGSNEFSSSTATPLTQVTNKDSVNINVASSANPDTIDQPVTFTATIAAAAPGSATPTQPPTWTISGRGGAPVPCKKTSSTVSGTTLNATCKVAADELVPSRAPYTVTAAYPGDHFLSAGSASIAEQVNLAQSTVTLTVHPPATSGAKGTITATVSGSPASLGTPAGTVSFTIQSTQGTAVTCSSGSNTLTLSGGAATCKVKGGFVDSGSPYTAQASYSGSSVFAPSTSAVSDITVP